MNEWILSMNSDQSLRTLKPLQVRHFAGQVGTICSCSNEIDQDKSLVVIKAGRFLNFIYTIAPWKQTHHGLKFYPRVSSTARKRACCFSSEGALKELSPLLLLKYQSEELDWLVTHLGVFIWFWPGRINIASCNYPHPKQFAVDHSGILMTLGRLAFRNVTKLQHTNLQGMFIVSEKIRPCVFVEYKKTWHSENKPYGFGLENSEQ